MRDVWKSAIAACLILMISTGATADEMAKAWKAFDGGDYRTARQIWEIRASEGDTEAMVALAAMAETGTGQPVDLNRARELYVTAAENGNPDAMQNLAVMLECGRGVPIDVQAALALYNRARLAGKAWSSRQVARITNEIAGVSSPCR